MLVAGPTLCTRRVPPTSTMPGHSSIPWVLTPNKLPNRTSGLSESTSRVTARTAGSGLLDRLRAFGAQIPGLLNQTLDHVPAHLNRTHGPWNGTWGLFLGLSPRTLGSSISTAETWDTGSLPPGFQSRYSPTQNPPGQYPPSPQSLTLPSPTVQLHQQSTVPTVLPAPTAKPTSPLPVAIHPHSQNLSQGG